MKYSHLFQYYKENKTGKKQKLYSGHTHYGHKIFLPHFYIMNLEPISPRELYSLKYLTGTVNFSLQLSEQWVSLETATANILGNYSHTAVQTEVFQLETVLQF